MELKIGDKVMVRPWDELVEEYGKHGDCIDCAVYFSSGLHKDAYGKELTIEEVDHRDDTIRVNYNEHDSLWMPVGFVTKISSAKEFEIGDKVRVRPWNELLEEYGIDDDGDINTPSYYLDRNVYEACEGHSLTVTAVDTDETVQVEGGEDDNLWIPCCALVKEDEEVAGVGTANVQEHYKKAAMQPLEVMQTLLSPEQFEGFLLGNVIKYRMRAQFKGQEASDHEKALQYAYWYSLVKGNCLYKINPVDDVPPADWTFGSIVD